MKYKRKNNGKRYYQRYRSGQRKHLLQGIYDDGGRQNAEEKGKCICRTPPDYYMNIKEAVFNDYISNHEYPDADKNRSNRIKFKTIFRQKIDPCLICDNIC